ncbi:Crp/Fnr family transcriptional regulator [Flavobacterium pallidum]|uniref:Cyclic nucleotide-binding protein n=1 Tax=Flavobacterium pallidum TaxID=2172098 RepID=A0A2S1SJY9_9FLAO|nr:Crp/Fnr family transcriptional regulator [Flavobacterium pallidum]AWI26750.1 cyclic nucleotide-binding protein [Flavobacterium pallidum]
MTLEQSIKTYFGVIHAEELTQISVLFQPEKVKKGDYLLHTGKVCDRLCFIQSGMLRIFVSNEDKEVTQWISTPGYFVTDLSSLLFKQPARWTIQALTDCTLYTIDRVDYDRIGDIIPKWHQLEKLFIAKCFTILEDRIFIHLSMSAEERYDFFFSNNKDLFNQVPLQYLASMLGMTPETLSRIRRKRLKS